MSLLRLPDELLSKIAQDANQEAAWLIPVGSMLARVSRDFRSLALVNRRLYNICLPMLWQLVKFPAQTVSPKHGHLVKTLVLSLFDPCFYRANPSLPEEIERYYKKFGLRDDYHREDLSPGSMFSLVKQCPNIQALYINDLDHLDFGHHEDEDRYLENAQSLFTLSLTSPPSNLVNLRYLKLYSLSFNGIPEEYPVELISHLPVLESVSCGNISERRYPDETPSLGWVLSRLRYLKSLEVWSVHHSWDLHSWAAPLESLTLGECSNITYLVDLQFTHHFVQRFAKTLTKLDISAKHHPEEVPDPEEYCTLPKLTTLRLLESIQQSETLHTFRNCKNIQHMEYSPPGKKLNWKLLLRDVAGSTWPNLRSLTIETPDKVPSHYQADQLAMVEFCQSAGIQFKYGDDVEVYDDDY